MLQSASPVVDGLDPEGYIMYRLFRDATKYDKGTHLKVSFILQAKSAFQCNFIMVDLKLHLQFLSAYRRL